MQLHHQEEGKEVVAVTGLVLVWTSASYSLTSASPRLLGLEQGEEGQREERRQQGQ
jgi:hypothetical protein